MNKMFKKVLSTVLAVAMLASMSTGVFAQEREKPIHGIGTQQEEVQPRYVPCPVSGKHAMAGRGLGIVHSGGLNSPVVLNGYAGQCSKCNIIMITEYNMFNEVFNPSGIPGKYAAYNSNTAISSNGAICYYGLLGELYEPSVTDSFFSGFEYYGL